MCDYIRPPRKRTVPKDSVGDFSDKKARCKNVNIWKYWATFLSETMKNIYFILYLKKSIANEKKICYNRLMKYPFPIYYIRGIFLAKT